MYLLVENVIKLLLYVVVFVIWNFEVNFGENNFEILCTPAISQKKKSSVKKFVHSFGKTHLNW